MLNFLCKLHQSGLSYSALNTARSALSTFLTIQNEPIGRHPFVIRFLKGCYQLRPSIPKNIVTWDVNIVLRYLDDLFPLDKITFRNLTLKCVTLLAILSAQRASALHSIDVRNITMFEKEVKIRFGDLLKTSRPGVHQAEIAIAAFPRKALCLVHTLDVYLNYTKKLREDHTQLFISFIPPHRPVVNSSISRWIKTVLISAGVDMAIFTPHSTRSASTSAAKVSNVPMQTILKTAGWSNDCTFAKFYDKQIPDRHSFARNIQSGASEC